MIKHTIESRGADVHTVWTPNGTASCWVINGTEMLIGEMNSEPGFWLIPNDAVLDDEVKKIGPFASPKIAQMVITLLDEGMS